MNKIRSILVAGLFALGLGATPALAAGEAVHIERQAWSFSGPFGVFDENQLQRGFQVFREVCAACHGARLLAFRNLSQSGGPGFSEAQVRALAAEYRIADEHAETGLRPAVPADRWPNPFPSDRDARDANQGVLPPDLSVMAKARTIETPFPWWILNYFTGYQEGGADYLHALLTGYHDEAPEGVVLGDGQYYNDAFPGHAIAMPPPLFDEQIGYADPEFPQSVDQYSRDVTAFLMWVAEPHLMERRDAGFRVILFLLLFTGLMWMVKERLWAPIHHHNPSPDDVEAKKADKQA